MPQEPKKTAIKGGKSFAELIDSGDKETVAVRFEGTLFDIATKAPGDGTFERINVHSKDGMTILRHSSAHLLAQAVLQLYPDALLNAGPPTDEGFYYDIMMDSLSSEDLERIEERMKELAGKDLKIERHVLSRDELLQEFGRNRFKVDKIMDNVPVGKSSTMYKQGEFKDFCTGPHVPSTGYLKNVKLLSTSATNYRGDENRERMVRIYGTAFPSAKELKEYLIMREEALKRDHRKIGQEMDLFVFNSERAPGLPLYTPNGTVIRNELITFMRNLNRKYGWEEVSTPHIFRDTMWKQSGHFAKYKDNMYIFTLPDGSGYAIRPMNCPGHITIFERQAYSYRDLPVKLSEPGQVYRYEKSGEVGGLTRPRTFTIDDGHAFLREDQIVDEVIDLLEMAKETFNLLGKPKLVFELSIMDENHPENYLVSYKCRSCGSSFEARRVASEEELQCPSCSSFEVEPDLSKWRRATESLRTALSKSGLEYQELPGEAAFYGPKIDVHVSDAIGRMWQCTTIQVDFNLPLNFNLKFMNSEGKKEDIVMVHRGIFGSYERFTAIMLESFAGHLPTWISPLQVYIAPVSEKYNAYAGKVASKIKAHNIRLSLDTGTETLNKKLRLIREKRPSYIVVLGEREESSDSVTVRNRKNVQKSMQLDAFLSDMEREIETRSPDQTI